MAGLQCCSKLDDHLVPKSFALQKDNRQQLAGSKALMHQVGAVWKFVFPDCLAQTSATMRTLIRGHEPDHFKKPYNII